MNTIEMRKLIDKRARKWGENAANKKRANFKLNDHEFCRMLANSASYKTSADYVYQILSKHKTYWLAWHINEDGIE